MKAITVSHVPATDTKPTRLKAKAEGVPSITRSKDELDDGTDGSSEAAARKLAQELCRKYGWGQDLVSGVLPDLSFVFCFAQKPQHPHWNPASHWDEHPDHPVRDWAYEAEEDVTRQSYVEWVNSRIENDE